MSRLSLATALPKPKYTGEDEEPAHVQTRGPRVVGAGALDESQIVLKVGFYLCAEKRSVHVTDHS